MNLALDQSSIHSLSAACIPLHLSFKFQVYAHTRPSNIFAAAAAASFYLSIVTLILEHVIHILLERVFDCMVRTVSPLKVIDKLGYREKRNVYIQA